MYGIAKKEGGSEELSPFTEGSFEDTVIIISFDSSFNQRYKKDELYRSTSMLFMNFSCKVSAWRHFF